MPNNKRDDVVLFVRVNDSDGVDAFVPIDEYLASEGPLEPSDVDTKEETIEILEKFVKMNKGKGGLENDRN